MRIAFVGKGGSGKTTVASLFARHLSSQDKAVLAIDADLNQHLRDALGLPRESVKKLGLEQSWLKTCLVGNNPRVHPKEMIKTTPPGNGSRIFRNIEEVRTVLADFIVTDNSLALLSIGEQTEEDTGVRCYHSKTGVVELLMNHFLDTQDEYVVVDMTAGADAFASGLYDKFDLTVVVVEPTQKSVDVFHQYATQAKRLGVFVKAVGNKVFDYADREFLQQQLGEDLVAVFTHSRAIRSAERGNTLSLHDLEEENIASLDAIRRLLDEQLKDWSRYFVRTIEIHRKNAQSWGNASTGKDLELQIDPNFSYPM